MHWIDLVIIGIIALSAIISFMRGFVREMLSLLVWVAAVAIGYKLYPVGVTVLNDYLSFIPVPDDMSIQNVAGGVMVFLAALLVLGIISYLITNVLLKKALGFTDRLLAIVLGVARGVLLVGIIGIVLITFKADDPKEPLPWLESDGEYWSESSQLWPHARKVSVWLNDVANQFIEDWRREKPTEATEVEIQR